MLIILLFCGTVSIAIMGLTENADKYSEFYNVGYQITNKVMSMRRGLQIIGQVFEGKVVSIKDFGVFLEFAPGKEGMVHISKIAKHRVNKVEDVLKMGDVVKAVCLGKDKMGRFSFSMRDVAE